jgi:voltage-gated potassium channel
MMTRRQVYEVLEGGNRGNFWGRIFDRLAVVLIFASVTAALGSTNATSMSVNSRAFFLVEAACGIFFAVEYVLRIWVATEDRRNRYTDPLKGRLHYMLTPLSMIDLIAFLPLVLSASPDINVEQLWLLRALRILKLLRYSSAIDTLGTVLKHERRPLLAAANIMLTLLVVLSCLMYLIEKDAQPDKYSSVPDTMWWGIVTLTTVGYGDIVPITPLGRFIGGLTVVLGMGMFALPAGILANGFAEEMRRRNFVVTWNLVANVPFFEALPAARIAEIAGVLHSQLAMPRETIVQQGDPADCMYFIVEGQVEVKLMERSVFLGEGDFFGEIALLTESTRTATVIAATTTQLLVLRVDEFRQILAAHDDLREHISRVARERLGAAPVNGR